MTDDDPLNSPPPTYPRLPPFRGLPILPARFLARLDCSSLVPEKTAVVQYLLGRPTMIRQEIRDLVRQFASVTGWLCLGFAAASSIGLFFLFLHPTKSKGGGPEAAYEICILFAIPFLIFLSAPLIFFSHPRRSSRISLAYWAVMILAFIPWIIALVDFRNRGGGYGFQNALRAWGL